GLITPVSDSQLDKMKSFTESLGVELMPPQQFKQAAHNYLPRTKKTAEKIYSQLNQAQEPVLVLDEEKVQHGNENLTVFGNLFEDHVPQPAPPSQREMRLRAFESKLQEYSDARKLESFDGHVQYHHWYGRLFGYSEQEKTGAAEAMLAFLARRN